MLEEEKYFNSRPCVRGDPGVYHTVPFAFQFQFTPLREGRHILVLKSGAVVKISIHAPA